MSVKNQQVSKPAAAKGNQASLGVKPRSRGMAGNHTLLKNQEESSYRPSFEVSELVVARSCGCDPHSSGGSCTACRQEKNSPRNAGVSLETENITNESVSQLRLSRPTDQSEREADRVAHEIVSNSASSLGKVGKLSQPTVSAKHLSPEHRHDSEVDPGIGSRVTAAIGSGRPLPEPVRDFFEPRLDRDLGTVRIHTDATAAATSQSLNAAAFTLGSDIFFNAGHFNPTTPSGVGLIAHELTHVAQHQAGNISRQIIQRDELPYQTLKWEHFKGAVPGGLKKEGAGILSNFRAPTPSFSPEAKDTKKKCNLKEPVKGRKTDTVYEGVGVIKSDQFDAEFQPYMDMALSWVLPKLKDDGASECATHVATCESDFDQNKNANVRFGSATATTKAHCRGKFRTACLAEGKQESTRVRAHEQGHFDITNVMSGKARDDVKATAAAMKFVSTGCGPTEAMDALEKQGAKAKQDLKDLGEKWRTLNNTVQDEYDTKTNHGAIPGKQQDWETKIQKGLVGYSVPAATTAPAAPPANAPAPAPAPPAKNAPPPPPNK